MAAGRRDPLRAQRLVLLDPPQGRKVTPQATQALRGANVSAKNELLYSHGINVNDLPLWQRRGIGLWWQTVPHTGRNPVTGSAVTVTRRRVTVDRELPMGDAYREFIAVLANDCR